MTNQFVVLKTFEFQPEAEAAKSFLASEGIPAVLVDGEMVGMNWVLGNAVGYIKLTVQQGHAERALELLESLTTSGKESDEADIDKCLACGASIATDGSACPKCGWSYETDLDNPSGSSIEESTQPVEEGEVVEGATTSQRLRNQKKLVIWLLLIPPLFMFALLVLGSMVRFLQLFF